ncbi:DUF1295 domain-containing protein [bacterium]|nr:DUF1295 domain-containing protein [bacterium]
MMTDLLIYTIFPALLAVSCLFWILYRIQKLTGDAGIVDVGWAAGLGCLALFYAFALSGDPYRRIALALLAGFWSFRLALYLLFNRVLGKEEDGRYKSIRESWQGNIQTFFFWFFQAQGLLDIILSLSFLIVALNPQPFPSYWDMAAVMLFLISITGESMADRQLARFRANPGNKGKTCRRGLWKYSRHPNYFFEWLHWWVYVFLALGSPYWWITLIAPALMLYFILYITGIPPTEAQAIASRGEDYKNYQQTTSAFIPWFPKKEIS